MSITAVQGGLTLCRALLDARCGIISCNPHNYFVWQILLLSSFYISEDRGPERLCDVAEATELVAAGARII